MKVAIIGAGLAGLSTGYVLAQSGADVAIYEASNTIASGASGNEVGMVNPRFSAHDTPESQFYRYSFDKAVALYRTLSDIEWLPCGALHLMSDEKRKKRYKKMIENWPWDDSVFRHVTADEATQIAGIECPYESIFLPQSGRVSPVKLCKALAAPLNIQTDTPITNLDDIDADVTIVAAAMESNTFIPLPLQRVRGQITFVKASTATQDLKVNMHYGGYCSAPVNGTHAIGATFQRWLNHTDILPEDNAYNIEKLQTMLPFFKGDCEVMHARAAMRTTTQDHTPIVGHVRDHIYVTTGHGSHGLVTCVGAAYLLRDLILKNPVQDFNEILKTLSPLRF